MTIVSAIRQGDHAIFKEVFDQYHQKLYFFILQKTKSEYLAEEVMQLAFIKLWESRHTLNEDFAISTQLFRIATTILIDLLRKQNSNKNLMVSSGVSVTTMAAPGASARIDEKELQQKITEAVNDLPPVRRQVFEMSREKGMSHKEIADTLAVSVKTVESHIYKALKQIKKHLNIVWLLLLKVFL